MLNNNDRITPKQMTVIIITTLIGIGILSLPRNVVEKAGPDGWVLVLLGGLVALFVSFIITRLGTLFPGETFVEYSRRILSVPLGLALTLGFAVYFIIFSAFEVRVFAEVLKQFLLDRTPTEVIIITMVLTSAYAVRHGIEVLGRLAEILIIVMLVPYFLLLLPTLQDMDITNLLPFMRTPPQEILTGTLAVVTSYLGFEVMVLFQPYLDKPGYATRSLLVGVGSVVVIYLIVVITNISLFGIVEIKHIIWPTFTMFRAIEIPGAFLENVHGVIMTMWVVAIFMTLSVFYFSGVLVLSRIFKLREHGLLVFPLAPVIYILSLVPDNIASLYDSMDMFSLYLGLPYAFIIPVILYLVAKIRRLEGGKREDEKTAGRDG